MLRHYGDRVICRLSNFVTIFYKIIALISTNTLKLFFNDLQLPKFMQCLSVWSACRALQNCCHWLLSRKIRLIICNKAPLGLTGFLFKELKILGIQQSITYSRSHFIYKSLNKTFINSCE